MKLLPNNYIEILLVRHLLDETNHHFLEPYRCPITDILESWEENTTAAIHSVLNMPPPSAIYLNYYILFTTTPRLTEFLKNHDDIMPLYFQYEHLPQCPHIETTKEEYDQLQKLGLSIAKDQKQISIDNNQYKAREPLEDVANRALTVYPSLLTDRINVPFKPITPNETATQ